MTKKRGRPLKGTKETPPPGHRWCPRHNDGEGAFLLESEFYHNDETDKWSSYCKTCMTEWNHVHRPDRNKKRAASAHAEALDALSGKCMRCGEDRAELLRPYPLDPAVVEEQKGWNKRRKYTAAVRDPDGYRLLCANCATLEKRR